VGEIDGGDDGDIWAGEPEVKVHIANIFDAHF